MLHLVRLGLLLLFLLLSPFDLASADVFVSVDRRSPTVCPAFATDVAPPALDREGCRAVPFQTIDPQGRHIWAVFELNMPELDASAAAHLGLGVYAKASSHVYLNDVLIGENGIPGDTKATEEAGLMDRLYPLPPALIRTGENRVALRMSSHSGVLKLSAPIHGVFVAPSASPQSDALKRYWPSLLPFGAFVLGGLYFLVSAVRGRQTAGSALLAVMSISAALQLMSEVSRGLWAYPYWFHDLRLIAIAVCSALFGTGLAAYVILQFQPRFKAALIACALFLTLLALVLPSGFDAKASFALLVSSLFAACVALSAIRQGKGRAIVFAASLLAFSVINFIGAGQFLDAYFYFVVAALMVFLFTQQALAFAKEETLRRHEEVRADKLQYVLDQLESAKEMAHISVVSAGRMLRIACEDIAFIQGAGDYVELVLKNAETRLHTATLTDLEAQLPASFLRVHRSFLVNTNQIVSLERHAAGTGELMLATGQTIPVSRRVMPKVKAALS